MVVGAVSRGRCVSHMHAARGPRGTRARPRCWDRPPAVLCAAPLAASPSGKTIARMHLANASAVRSECRRPAPRSPPRLYCLLCSSSTASSLAAPRGNETEKP